MASQENKTWFRKVWRGLQNPITLLLPSFILTSPSASLSLAFSGLTWMQQKENLYERAVKQTFISDGELSGSACNVVWAASGASQGCRVWEHQQNPGSRHLPPNEPPQQDAGIREQWESPFISLEISTPLGERVYMCVSVRVSVCVREGEPCNTEKSVTFSHRLHTSCSCCMLRNSPKAMNTGASIGNRRMKEKTFSLGKLA